VKYCVCLLQERDQVVVTPYFWGSDPHVEYFVSQRLQTLQLQSPLTLFWSHHIQWIQEVVIEESLWFLAWDCQVTVLTKGDGMKLSVNVSAFEVNCQIANIITLVTEIIPPWATPARMHQQVDVAVWKDTSHVWPWR
jgi:hypothetical protein